MGNMTVAELALVQAAVDDANASLSRALAVIENAQAALERRVCGACLGEDFGGCPACGEPGGRVYGGGGADA